MAYKILIVDDDLDFCKDMTRVLQIFGEIKTVHSIEEFNQAYIPHSFDIALIDLRLKDKTEGLEAVKFIHEEEPGLPIIVMTSYASIENALEATELGAKTYIQKSRVTLQDIMLIVQKTLDEVRFSHQIESALESRDKIIGNDKGLASELNIAMHAAKSGENSILIRGETGTGKELVARYIHQNGIRKEHPFITCVIPSIPESLLASELFGHEKGTFTGASERHIGYLEQADKGILFLDEIGDLPNSVQIHLLRFLDDKIIKRVGGTKDIELNVQIISATNQNLENLMEEGKFRKDLYYRIKGITINLPPLRERSDDIQLLAEYFLKRLFKNNKTPANEYSEDAMKMLLKYDWPGNVRELKQTIENAALNAEMISSKKITLGTLPSDMRERQSSAKIRNQQNMGIDYILAETEMKYIFEALKKTGGRKSEACSLLGFSNRFILRRRVLSIFSKFPELKEIYPDIAEQFDNMA